MIKCLVPVSVLLILVLKPTFAINEACSDDSNCSKEEICSNSVCACNKLYIYSEELNKCVKYATEYGSICYMDSQCTPFLGENSACINNICLCDTKANFKWYQGKCQKYTKKSEACTSDSLCMDPKNPLALTCKSESCECSDGYYDRGDDCRLRSEKECAITMDCGSSTIGSHCELGKCIENSKVSAQNVTIPVKSSLIVYQDTIICPNGVLSNLTETECKECSNTLFFKDSICICKPGFFLDNGKCLAELGMQSEETVHFTNDSQCPIKPGKLVNGTCYCKDYWFQDSTNRECKKTTLEYTKNCMDNDWCKAMGDYAYCNVETGKCHCSSQAELNKTSFYCNKKVDANFTGLCLSDIECPLYETCVNEKCQCDEGFYRPEQSDVCLPKIGSSCEVRNCDHITHSTCSSDSSLCECNSGLVTDGLLCLEAAEAINEECQIEQQCQNLTNSACLQDKQNSSSWRCLCTEEFLDVNGACYALKSPGSICSSKFDCTIILGDSFVCRNMLCQCQIGQSLNQDNICVNSLSARISLNIILMSTLLIFKFLVR